MKKGAVVVQTSNSTILQIFTVCDSLLNKIRCENSLASSRYSVDPNKSALKMKPIFPLVHAVYPLASVFLMILARSMVDWCRVCFFNPIAHLSSVSAGNLVLNPLHRAFDLLHIARNFAKKGKGESRFVLHRFVQQLPSFAFL